MLLFRCAFSSQLMKLSVTNICMCSWHLKWFLPEIMGFSHGRPADTLLWTWKWRVTCLLVLLRKWVSKCLEQDYLRSLTLLFMSVPSSFTRKVHDQIDGRSILKNWWNTRDLRRVVSKQCKICISLQVLWDVYGMRQRDLYERKKAAVQSFIWCLFYQTSEKGTIVINLCCWSWAWWSHGMTK